jgi:hypothetical protein
MGDCTTQASYKSAHLKLSFESQIVCRTERAGRYCEGPCSSPNSPYHHIVSIRSRQPLSVSLQTDHRSKAFLGGFDLSLGSPELAQPSLRTTSLGVLSSNPSVHFNLGNGCRALCDVNVIRNPLFKADVQAIDRTDCCCEQPCSDFV